MGERRALKVLMLSSRIPYPLTAGFRIRIYTEAKYFHNDGNQVDLLFLGNQSDLKKYRNELKKCYDHCYCIQYSKSEAVKNIIRCVTSSKLPLQVALYRNEAFKNKLLSIQSQYDLIIGNHIRTSEYLKLLNSKKVILDMHDAISYNYKNAIKLTKGFKKWIYKYEYSRVLAYECNIVSAFSRVVLISAKDRDWLKEHGADTKNVTLIPVAVRDDIKERKEDYSKDENIICFLGKMSYQPNTDAVLWFYNEVFPELKKLNPQLMFYIMGIEPTQDILKLQNDPNVKVTGFLKDPYEIMAKAKATVVPIRNGAGIQNKVLESMLIGTPVVASSIAAEGIEAKDGEHLLIAHNKKEFVDKTNLLLQSQDQRERIGKSGQQYIEDNYTWNGLWKKWKALANSNKEMSNL